MPRTQNALHTAVVAALEHHPVQDLTLMCAPDLGEADVAITLTDGSWESWRAVIDAMGAVRAEFVDTWTINYTLGAPRCLA